MAWLEGLAIIALVGAFLGVALWTRAELNDIAQHGTERRSKALPEPWQSLWDNPDDYTLVEYRGKLAADGPRYKALGNSMAVPVMRWIGERLAMVDAL